MAEAVFEASEEVKTSAAAAASQPGTGGRPGKALNFIEYNQENGKQRLGLGVANEVRTEEVRSGGVLIVVDVVCRVHGGPGGQKLSHGLER